MIDQHSQSVLQDIVARESRSLLSYMAEAYPWTTEEGESGLKKLQRLIKEHGKVVTDLGRFYIRQTGAPPQIGSYPSRFTSLNFIALSFLVGKLLETEKQSMVQLKQDMTDLMDTTTKLQVDKLLTCKQQTIESLETIASASSQPASK